MFSGWATQVVTPGKQLTRLQVSEIALIGVCLALKRDVAIGIAPHGKPHQPFDEIKDIEEHKKHLTLLCRVNALVVHHLVAEVHPWMHKKYPQQVNRRESMKWQYRSTHNLHRDKGTIIFGNRQFPVNGCQDQAHMCPISATIHYTNQRILIKNSAKVTFWHRKGLQK